VSSPLTDQERKELHQRGYWINKQEEVVAVTSMSDSYLVNVLRFQFKIAQSIQGADLQRQLDRISGIDEGPFALRGEYARMTIERELTRDELASMTMFDTEDLLKGMPIVPHLYAEVRKRKLLDQFTTEQKAMLYLVNG
jgi:hypothetical protein